MSNLLKSLGNFYLYSSLHIAICAGLLTLESFHVLGITVQWHYILFISMSTMAVYSAHRLVGMSKVKAFADQGRYKVIKKYRHHILIYFILSFVFSVFFFFKLDFRQMALMICPGILTAAYVLPVFKTKRLRDFPFIKIFLIATVWTWLSLSIIWDAPINNLIVFLSIERILFFLAITIPFDIRDVTVDESIEVKTLVHKLGINRSKKLAILFLILCFGIIFSLLHFEKITFSYFIGLSTTYLVSSYLILRSNVDKGDYFYGGFLDGTIGLRFILIYIISTFFIH